jgi:CHASE3 domain sensor protein
VLLSAIIGSAFFLLVLAIAGLGESERRANHSLESLIAASRLERLVIDVETTQRGFIITGDPRFLRPWNEARAASAQEAANLERLASAGSVGQGIRVRQITRAADSYIMDYAVPLVAAAQRDLGSAQTAVETEEGKLRVDALRDKFDRFMVFERQIYRTGQQRAEAAADRAFAAATVSVVGSILLILLSGGTWPGRLSGPCAGRPRWQAAWQAGISPFGCPRSDLARLAYSNARSMQWRARWKRAATSCAGSRKSRQRCGRLPRSPPAEFPHPKCLARWRPKRAGC